MFLRLSRIREWPMSRGARESLSRSPHFEAGTPRKHASTSRVFGQSFHWVNPDIALPKAHRLLTNGGRLALMWNRLFPTHPTRRRPRRDIPGLHRSGLIRVRWLTERSRRHRASHHRRSPPRSQLADSPLRSTHARATPALPRGGGLTSHSPIRSSHPRCRRRSSELRARLAERIGSTGVSVGGDTVLMLAHPLIRKVRWHRRVCLLSFIPVLSAVAMGGLPGVVKLLTWCGAARIGRLWRLRRGTRATGIRSRSSGTRCGCITVSR